MSTPAPAVAPYVPTYASRSPYLTAAEYLAAPTGVSATGLVPNQSQDEAMATLVRQIARASAWADTICHQVLAATTDVQAGKYRPKADGTVVVVCDYSPIVYVTDIAVGGTPQTLTSFTDLSGVWPNGKVIEFPLTSSAIPSGWDTRRTGSDVYVAVTYVNGYANTTLAADVTPSAASITVAKALGIVPGLPLRIDDGKNPIYVTVDASYQIGDLVVPLTGGCPNSYDAGASVSALPEAIKQAVISLTTALIKTRGTQAISMSGLAKPPEKKQMIESGGVKDYEIAQTLLGEFMRVV